MSAGSARRPRILAARPLMICVVLGAFTALIVALTRPLSLALVASAPWLAYPAPMPWFMPVIMAALLVRRSGAALVTGLVGAAAGGGMTLLAAVITELALLPVRSRNSLGAAWAVLVGVLVGLMTFGFMFVFPEFAAIGAGFRALALAVRLGVGVLYGWLAFLLVARLRQVGVGRGLEP